MSNKVPFIGITGGIGAGKTTVCRIFETLGAVTYYADDRAKWLMEHNKDVVAEVMKLMGHEAYVNKKLDRSYIAKRVFKNDALLVQLNTIVHPAVVRDAASWAKKNTNAKLLLKEAALLFETGSYEQLDKNILVSAPESIRITRVLQRDPHRTKADVMNIIKKQMSEVEKQKLADYVILNDESQSLIKQVTALYSHLLIT